MVWWHFINIVLLLSTLPGIVDLYWVLSDGLALEKGVAVVLALVDRDVLY